MASLLQMGGATNGKQNYPFVKTKLDLQGDKGCEQPE